MFKKPGHLQQRLPSLRLRYILVPAILWLIIGAIFLGSRHPQVVDLLQLQRQRIFGHESHVHRIPVTAPLAPLPEGISCFGPRGLLLSDSEDDKLQYSTLSDISYPVPFLGSQRELGIERTWMTADRRYGPYGFGEEKESYNRTKVDWENVDWGSLQDDCLVRNTPRFPQGPQSARIRDDVRFTWRNETMIQPTPAWDAFNSTRRTALVIRAYWSKKYTPEDMWNIRSIITETALATGGEYAVILLVHVQDKEKNIFLSKENYNAAFEEAQIPPELQSIAILWDDNLLESWYEAVGEYRTILQVNQPLQLFALHYPEFDHYWQVELDQRFMGDAGQYLNAVSNFARNEPRKQSLERATYAFNEEIYGTYDEFMRQVDDLNKGKSRAWGPMAIPGIESIGPEPLTRKSEDDELIWGVGEEADVIVTSFCADVFQTDWIFKDYVRGFENVEKVIPRWFCPPAIMRASRTLLLSIHQSQHDQGIALPSEAVLPSWALWHGLKLSYPPQPAYMKPSSGYEGSEDDWTRDPSKWLNTTITPWFGNSTKESIDGLSHGNPQSYANKGLTWWWASDYPREIMDAWISGPDADGNLPDILALHDGEAYIPNMAMHPVKT